MKWILVIVALCGVAMAAPGFTVTPDPIVFGTQVKGTSSVPLVVTITSSFTSTVPINSISIGGSYPSFFTQTATTCGLTIAAGASCTVSLTFSPLYYAPVSATLIVTVNSSTQTNNITGIGVAVGQVLYPGGSTTPIQQLNIFSGPINVNSQAYSHLIGSGGIFNSWTPGLYLTGQTLSVNLGCTASNCTGANATFIDHADGVSPSGGACPDLVFATGTNPLDNIVNAAASLGYINNFILFNASYGGGPSGNSATPAYEWSQDWANNLYTDCVHPDPSLTRTNLNSKSVLPGDYICVGGTFPNCTGGGYWQMQKQTCTNSDQTDISCKLAASPPACITPGTTSSPCNDGSGTNMAVWTSIGANAPLLQSNCNSNYQGQNCYSINVDTSKTHTIIGTTATLFLLNPSTQQPGQRVTVSVQGAGNATRLNCNNCIIGTVATSAPYFITYTDSNGAFSGAVTSGTAVGTHNIDLSVINVTSAIIQRTMPIPYMQQNRVRVQYIFQQFDAHYKNSVGYIRPFATKGGEMAQDFISTWPWYATNGACSTPANCSTFTSWEKMAYAFGSQNGCDTDFSCTGNLNSSPSSEAVYMNASNIGMDNNAVGTNHAYSLDCYSSLSAAGGCGATFGSGVPAAGALWHGGDWALEFFNFPTMSSGRKPNNTVQTTQESTPGSTPGTCATGTCSGGSCSTAGPGTPPVAVTGSMAGDISCTSSTFPGPNGYPGVLPLVKKYGARNVEMYFCDAALALDSAYTSLPSSVCPVLYPSTNIPIYKAAFQTWLSGTNTVPVFTTPNSVGFSLLAASVFNCAVSGVPMPALSLTSGSLPTGVTFVDNGNGVCTISGTPSVSGSFTVQLTAVNAAGTTNQSFTINILSQNVQGTGSGTGFFTLWQPALAQLDENAYCLVGDIPTGALSDGPAGGMQRCYFTNLSATPSPGSVVSVTSSGQLTTALAAAVCGETIQLQANTTYTGNFVVSTTGCDSGHYLTIETADVGSIPNEHTRINPSYAGVTCTPVAGLCTNAPLLGRPTYSGPDVNHMAQITQANFNSNSALSLAANVSYVRLIGLEITRNTGGPVTSPVDFLGGNSHVIFDRDWCHGTAVDETRRCFDLNQTQYIAVINSYIMDMHCLEVVGTCSDSQAYSYGGSSPLATDGAYKFVNNFAESAAENVESGGGTASFSPADIEDRLNHYFKPQIWNPSSPTYNGGVSGNAWCVKNIWETKSSINVLIEGDIMENNWEGCQQHGEALSLTVKNQSPNLCPACIVRNVIVRYVTIKNVTQWLSLVSSRSGPVVGWPTEGDKFSIHDIVADGIMYQYRNGTTQNDAGFSQDYSSSNPPPSTLIMNNVLVNHNTIVEQSGQTFVGMLNIGGVPAGNTTSTPQMTNINYNNNLQASGTSSSPFQSTGGGTDNCWTGHTNPSDILSACWLGTSSFSNNAIIPQFAGHPTWPATTIFPGNWSSVNFVNYNGGQGGDYRLCTGLNTPSAPCTTASPLLNAGSDGKNVGADVSTVQVYQNFVQ